MIMKHFEIRCAGASFESQLILEQDGLKSAKEALAEAKPHESSDS